MRALRPRKTGPRQDGGGSPKTWLRKIQGLTEVLERDAGRFVSNGELLEAAHPDAACERRRRRRAQQMAERYDQASAIDERGDRSYPQFMACVARICAAVRTGNECDVGAVEWRSSLIDDASGGRRLLAAHPVGRCADGRRHLSVSDPLSAQPEPRGL